MMIKCTEGHKASRFALILLYAALLIHGSSYAQSEPPSCFYQIAEVFFEDGAVIESLSIYKVEQNIWTPILQSLKALSKQSPSRIIALAEIENPNPLTPVFIPDAAARLLQKALYEILFTVMQSFRNAYPNNAINQNTIDGMFRYLWTRQYNQIQACLTFSPGEQM